MKTKTISIEKKLNEAEINEKAHEMAEKVFNKLTKQFEKKTAMSSFKAEIDALDEEINKLSEVINRGFIHEWVDCTYEDNSPLGIRIYFGPDGAEVKREPIPDVEQDALPFDSHDSDDDEEVTGDMVGNDDDEEEEA